MPAPRAVFLAAVLVAPGVQAEPAQADLTPVEQRWLDGVRPVVEWGIQHHLPLEITVLPQARAGDAPLAMGWQEGHCELVFAMRSNPAADATLSALPPDLLQPVLEAMAAHELGHCWRQQSGAFATMPAGLADAPDAIESRQPTPELKSIAHRMRVTRREEAFADLVGLAWTHRRDPSHFDAVLAWFDQARGSETERSFHDTRHWIALAHRASAFSGDGDPFQQAMTLWRAGLEND